MDAPTTVSLRVEGRVQGVGYRAWAAGAARALGLDGWVRNRAAGSVELALAGPSAQVAEMVARCRRGPPAALVTRVEAAALAAPPEPGFHTLPSR